jgi:hypothetical protein
VHPAPYASIAQCTFVIWGGSLITACLVTDLGIVFQVLGGIACSLVILILPGLMLLLDGLDQQQLASGVVDGQPEVRNIGQLRESLEHEAAAVAVDRIPLLVGEAPLQAERAPISDTDIRHRATLPTHAATVELSAADLVAIGLRSGCAELQREGNGLLDKCSGPDVATQVLGWTLVSLGLCIMALTVYLTLFG